MNNSYNNKYILYENNFENSFRDSFEDSLKMPFNDNLSLDSFELKLSLDNGYLSSENEYISDGEDRNSNITVMYDDKISLISSFGVENIDNNKRKTKQSIINTINNINIINTSNSLNKIFESKPYIAELNKQNTFLNKKQHQTEFNKLILDIKKIKCIDKFILNFI